jgi:hypothetical protein
MDVVGIAKRDMLFLMQAPWKKRLSHNPATGIGSQEWNILLYEFKYTLNWYK